MVGRRRSTSGSSCDHSPPYTNSTPWPLMSNSPLRRASTNVCVVGTTSGSLPTIMGSPTKIITTTAATSTLANVCENAAISPVSSSGMVQWRNVGGAVTANAFDRNPLAMTAPTRAMTLPEFACKTHQVVIVSVQLETTVFFFSLPGSPAVGMCGPSQGFQRSQTDVLISCSPVSNRSPAHYFPAMQNSNGSNWSLQRKPSFDQQLGAFGFGTSPPQMEGPIVFVASDLTQETLMEVRFRLRLLAQGRLNQDCEWACAKQTKEKRQHRLVCSDLRVSLMSNRTRRC